MQTNARRRPPANGLGWPSKPVRSYPHGGLTGQKQTWRSVCGKFEIVYHTRGSGRYVLWLRTNDGFYNSLKTDFSTLVRAKAAAFQISRGWRVVSRSMGEVKRWFVELWERSSTGLGRWMFHETGHVSEAVAEHVAREMLAARSAVKGGAP